MGIPSNNLLRDSGMAKDRMAVQTAIRLSAEMHEWLMKSPLSVSEEIRRRLAEAMDLDRFDKEAQGLALSVMRLAKALKDMTGVPWESHPEAAAALSEAIVLIIRARQEEMLGWVDMDEFGFHATTVGKMLARAELQKLKEKKE
jgi:hypothetical protein